MLRFVFFFFGALSLSSLEIDLNMFEKSIYSQNGEDGVLEKIFELIEPTSKFCVEFGAYDGVTGSNTYLLRQNGWDAFLLDKAIQMPERNLFKAFITAENINQLFLQYEVPCEFGLLSIDIDYNDFYVWKAIDEKYEPAVVVIEYNATHLPDEDKVVRYHPFYCGGASNYFGASILAYYYLGRSKGYSLVYAEQHGVNLFFIRDEILNARGIHFKNQNDVEKLYRRPTYGNGPNNGHPEDPRFKDYVTAKELLNLE